MTADQFQQVVTEVLALAGAVFANGKWRKRISRDQCEVESEQVDRLEVEGKLTREELRATRDEMVRLKDRMAEGEKSDERLRSEMHALSGRVDAANATYTEMLELAKTRKAASQTTVQPGAKPDIQDQTKVTLKKEEKPK